MRVSFNYINATQCLLMFVWLLFYARRQNLAGRRCCSRSTCVYPPSVDSITRDWLVRPPDQSILDDSARNGRTQYICIKRWATRTDVYVAESAQRMTAVCRSAGIYMCQSGKKQRLTDRDSSPRSGFNIFQAMSLRLVLLRCSSHLLPCVHHGRPL